jgi:hypothetical protein
MTAQAEDYLWVTRSFPDFAVSHCVTTVVGKGPTEVLRSLGVTDSFVLDGMTAVEDRVADLWSEYDGRQLLVSAVEMNGSTLLVEPNGYVGVEQASTLSAGSTVVAHYRNVNALYQLIWQQDGRLLLDFDALRPAARTGERVGSVEPLLREAGFTLDDDEGELMVEASFAFAENVTGIRPTAGVLLNSTFTCGVVAGR